MTRGTGRRAAVVASVLAVDGLVHVYWATGATWPAHDTRSLSNAVLGGTVPFTPPVVLPLAALLFGAAAAVYACGRPGRPAPRRPRWPLRAVTGAVAAGLLVRALAGLVWVAGVGVAVGSPFYWLNLFVYTPLCLALGVAAVGVAGIRAWKPALVGPLMLCAVVLYGALPRTYQPALVVWGAQDTVLPVAQAARFGRLLPSARITVLDGCGHALPLDCPERVTALMGDFLGER
jgi:pimeloyl-ACP methyl ester carboxylesterase